MSINANGEECGWCRFWFSPNGGGGECRRRAPLAVPNIAGLDVEALRDNAQHIISRDAVWPLTAFWEWCGEFEGIKFDESAPDKTP